MPLILALVKKQTDFHEFKISVFYIVHSGLARDKKRDPVLKTEKEKKKGT